MILLLLFASANIQAQIQFELVLPPPPTPQTITDFAGVTYSSIAFADVDADGDQDVLITGANSSSIAKLYENDGNGNYTEVSGTTFDGVWRSSIAFADVDGDGDWDVLITGLNSSSARIAKLYINDGSGTFSVVADTPFEGVERSSIAFADVDGDGDQDVLITGLNAANQRIAKLYTNDGNGNYSLVTGAPFDGVQEGDVGFADVDGDGDQDVLITGFSNSGRSSKLYTNDGNGNYNLLSGSLFDKVELSSIAFADVDGDGDQDVLITGFNGAGQLIAKLYISDEGGINEVPGTLFDGVQEGSVAFADVDGDGDPDVLVTGQSSTGASAKLYINIGNGSFTLSNSEPIQGVKNSSIAFADVDGDGDQDVLITGSKANNSSLSALYKNDGNGNYNSVNDMPFDGVRFSSIAFADVDGDADQDVLITGSTSLSLGFIAKLYRNDGSGIFNLVIGTPFEGVSSSSIGFADVDSDGDQDVLITGGNGAFQRIAKLYTNDGNGNFSLVNNTPFNGVTSGSIAFSDVDNDGDEDVFITGLNSSNQRIAKLYTNDGNGNFSVVNGTPFDGVTSSSIAFADIDGDGDQDVLVTGLNVSSQSIAKLYNNDGIGNFSLVSDTPFDGVQYGSVAFADVDGDGDQDVLITGLNSAFERIAKLYNNDGIGNFSLVSDTPFDGVQYGSVAFADVDGDGDQDVLITGNGGTNEVNQPNSSKFYTNDGSGNFSLVDETPFVAVDRASIAFADVDGDGDPEVMITGNSNFELPVTELYNNDGSGNYRLVIDPLFNGVLQGSVAFADVDGDGDQDVLISGSKNTTFTKVTATLYNNDSSGIYDIVHNTPFIRVARSSSAFADVDGDGDQDVLIAGFNNSGQRIARLYSNDSYGNYSIQNGTPFDGVQDGSIAFADVDGDGDQDLLLTGLNSSSERIAKLYQNNGSGNFSLINNTPFDGVMNSSIAFADIDGDGDQDVLITGLNSSSARIAKLYTNDGSGNFSLVSDTPFDGVWRSSIAFADVDGDGDQDVLLTGLNSSSERTAKLYTNDGIGNFSSVSDTPFNGVERCSIAFADVDSDGDQDVLITGRNSTSQRISQLYTNDGLGNFIFLSSTPFDGVEDSSVAFADVDGDGDPDVLITGSNSSGIPISKLYRNITPSPCSITASCAHYTLTLSSSGIATLQPENIDNGSSVTCGTPILTLSQTDFDTSHIGENTVTLTVTDENGNEESCNSIVTVVAFTCAVNGGTVSSTSPRQNLCIGDGVSNIVQLAVSGYVGQGRFGLARQPDLQVVATNSTGIFNMENFPAVNYLAGYISVNDLSELDGVDNVNDLNGCYDLSNYLSITTVTLNGGTITANNGTTACGNDGNPSNLSFTSTGSAGPNFMWAVLSQNYSTVLASNTTGVFDFDQFGPGTYRVVRIVYSNVNPATIVPPSLPPCVAQSNVITINITSCGFGLHSQPNPTDGESIVSFTAVSDEWYTLEVYDMQGRHIHTIMSQVVQADEQYRYTFNGSALPNGVYIYRLTTDTEVLVEKFMIAR